MVAPSDGMVGEHLAQPRQSRIAACRCGFVRSPPPRFAGMDSAGRPSGSALAQRLYGSLMPLIQCDDCPRTVLWLTSGKPKHPGWVFFKCENEGLRVVLHSAHLDSSLCLLIWNIIMRVGKWMLILVLERRIH